MKYYEVPEDILEDLETLGHWVEKALAVAARSRAQRR